jgi:thiol:disulfide interchange protein DsbD
MTQRLLGHPLQRSMRPGLLGLLALIGFCALRVAAASDDGFLPVEQVFRYSASSDGHSVDIHWNVAQGYYLYKARMSFGSDSPGVTLGTPLWPRAAVHQDEYFGKQDIFRGEFTVRVPLTAPMSTGPIALQLKLQGCADAGLCYPPQVWKTSVAVPAPASAAADASGAPASAAPGLSGLLGARRRSNDDGFLPPEQAFRVAALPEGPDRVRILWEIAPGYYLYRDRFKVATPAAGITLGKLELPRGEPHEDEYFGSQEIYRGELAGQITVAGASASAAELPLTLTYQGCADAGLCYPPQTQHLSVSMAEGATAAGRASPAAGAGSGSAAAPFVSEQDRLANLIRSGNIVLVLGTFFGLGLLLAFTPCVLPMVPILSGIIAGQGANASTGRSFALSLAYVLGMALTNTVAGVLAALAGAHVQAIFQQTWIILLFGGLFVVLAISMFGFFTLQMPAAIQTRLSDTSNRQRAGTFGGVAVMGALSALIVTACVAPALVATLAVIGQGGNAVRGGAALFTMSFGMGVPLLLVGASAGKLLPKAGAWMDTVKQLFGVMMLGVAAWMFARLVSDRVALLLWAVPALIAAGILWTAAVRRARHGIWLLRGVGVAAGLYGIALIAGAALGGSDPLAPIPRFAAHHATLEFRPVKSLADLDGAVAAASRAGRPVLLDFYADWCVSCKEMEKYTFTDPGVQQALGTFVLLRADVTANNDDDQALLKRFGIFGPPTIAFYGADGTERGAYRVVGYMKAPEFAATARASIRATAGATHPAASVSTAMVSTATR